jgi:hypothetical protein
MQTSTKVVKNEVTTYTATVRIPRPVGKLVSKIKTIRSSKSDKAETPSE